MTPMTRRLVLGSGIAVFGASWCLLNDHHWDAYPVGLDGDLILALPFYVLGGAAALGRPRRAGTALVALALAAFESLAYHAAGTTDSSTAGLAFLLPVFYGTGLVAVAVLAQVLVDAFRDRATREFVAGLSDAERAEWAGFISQEPR